MSIFITLISKALSIGQKQVENTIKLLEEGATIPFISRYRKEMTGSLDEVQVSSINDMLDKLKEVEKRKTTILSTIEQQEKLTPELRKKIEECWDSIELEDIYLPYKPKRRTRAEMAKEKGLEPLATLILLQQKGDVELAAQKYLSDKVADTDDALKGARDIIAEVISEDIKVRNSVRNIFAREAVITSKVVKGKEAEAEKYRDYFDFSEPLSKSSSHRILALRRGENEGFLKVSISPAEDEKCIDRIDSYYVKSNNEASKHVAEAVEDSFKRLIKPTIETEFAQLSKENADEAAIRVFASNLRQLLLAAPLGEKRVLAIDPGYRTGCKVVCLDAQGNLLHNETIYPHPPQSQASLAGRKITSLVEQYSIEAISIGNGTASRETEAFIKKLQFDRKLQVFVVSEDGASIYSASKIAREEFPEYDVTVRGAVSIGRRLLDPLAELVKIDPKSIGVGQYQYDVNQSMLKKSLDQTVENCVNQVGVNVNTASKHLLTYVSGLGPLLAKNIVEYRAANGPFKTRKELMKVPRMGDKAFEQSAGFLRIANAKNPLDNSAVHPESYFIVEQIAKDLKCKVDDLISNSKLISDIDTSKYIKEGVGEITLKDIISELEKPGRDPRQNIKVFEFDSSVRTIDDLREGAVLPGIVTNITNFGAFVDVGIKENGLVHVSQIADKFITDPTEYISVHQHVYVKVMSVDRERKRVQLTMKGVEQNV